MKKILLLALLSATTFFTSCNNDDNSDSTSTQEELLIGTWKLKESGKIINGNDVSDDLSECELKSNITFNKDTFSDDFYELNNTCENYKENGEWSLIDDVIKIKYSENDKSELTILKLTKDELRLKDSHDIDGDYYSVYSRVN
ncbi:lipocalin family protein [Chishuiella sp.]|uniref:lipocalin family protein n=1 Tax=Chishuiella sp. TaxID=1969467 RepID=UPI0028A8289F|nr:lipocalin family protein [Chishuiella sp.]